MRLTYVAVCLCAIFLISTLSLQAFNKKGKHRQITAISLVGFEQIDLSKKNNTWVISEKGSHLPANNARVSLLIKTIKSIKTSKKSFYKQKIPKQAPAIKVVYSDNSEKNYLLVGNRRQKSILLATKENLFFQAKKKIYYLIKQNRSFWLDKTIVNTAKSPLLRVNIVDKSEKNKISLIKSNNNWQLSHNDHQVIKYRESTTKIKNYLKSIKVINALDIARGKEAEIGVKHISKCSIRTEFLQKNNSKTIVDTSCTLRGSVAYAKSGGKIFVIHPNNLPQLTKKPEDFLFIKMVDFVASKISHIQIINNKKIVNLSKQNNEIWRIKSLAMTKIVKHKKVLNLLSKINYLTVKNISSVKDINKISARNPSLQITLSKSNGSKYSLQFFKKRAVNIEKKLLFSVNKRDLKTYKKAINILVDDIMD